MPNWLEDAGITDAELLQNPNLTKYTNLQDALKGHVELAKTLGNRVAIPGPNSTAEEKAAFFAKIGRPESADKYDLGGLEGPLADLFREKMFEGGAPAELAKAVAMGFAEYGDKFAKDQEAQAKAFLDGEKATLTKEWGDNYNANMEFIQERVKTLGGDDLLKVFEANGVLANAQSAKFLNEVLKATTESGFIHNKGQRGTGSAKAEYEKLTGDSAFMDKVNKGDPVAREQHRKAAAAALAEERAANPGSVIEGSFRG